jgi:hypothetical protein
MKFALGGNHDENNAQTANERIAHILYESVYAEGVGRHSAWIGEHHFSIFLISALYPAAPQLAWRNITCFGLSRFAAVPGENL